MNVLCIGDIIGRSGAETVAAQLPYLKKDYAIDFVIANAENSTTGNGINRDRADFLLDHGIDILTMGNHTFQKKNIFPLLEEGYPIVRPLNMPKKTAGTGCIVKTVQDKKIAVINLIGRVYMSPADCPFSAVDDLLSTLEADYIFVDFHAEATSEKAALAWFLDGRVTAVFGTHTHVQTADEKILPKGTGFITDIGMCGAVNSVLGIKKDIAVRRFTTMLYEPYEIAQGHISINAVLFQVDDIVQKITRLSL